MNPSLKSAMQPYVEYIRRQGSQGVSQPQPKLTVPEQEIMQEAGKAMKAWLASAEGKSTMSSVQNMSLVEVNTVLSDLLEHPVFAKTMQLIHNHPNLLPTLRSFPIHSVSIGFTFEANILVGVSGSVGYAIDPTEPLGVSSSFLSLSLKEGADLGAFGGLQFGIWEPTPDNMGGYSRGVELTLDPEIIGLSLGVYKGRGSGTWGATATAVAGEDAGLEFQESYTFLLTEADLDLKPVFQIPASHFLILDKLTCENTKDTGKDEVFFKFIIDGNKTYTYPSWDYRSMGDDSDNNEWEVGRSVYFNSKVEVVLYDGEPAGKSDVMKESGKDHSFKFDLDDFKAGSKISKTMNYKSGLDEVKYKLSAKLIK